MSYIDEFMNSERCMTPEVRRDNHKSGTVMSGFYSTAHVSPTMFRSCKKLTSRRVSFAPDLIAGMEELEHFENLGRIAGVEWKVFMVSPLWNVKYEKDNKSRNNARFQASQLNDSEFNLAVKRKYDPAALKRYSRFLAGFITKGQDDSLGMCQVTVDISHLQGIRGSQTDAETLEIKVLATFGENKQEIFKGMLTSVDASELEIKATNATVLPVLLAAGNDDTTDRIIYGLQKCFDCVIQPLALAEQELLALLPIVSGLGCQTGPNNQAQKARRANEDDTFIRPGRPLQARDNKNRPNGSTHDPEDDDDTVVKKKKEVTLVYDVPLPKNQQQKGNVDSITVTMESDFLEDLHRSVISDGEVEITEEEIDSFHSAVNFSLRKSIGLNLDKLRLSKMSTPYLSLSNKGRVTINIQQRRHVKLLLRYLTEMCQGDMLSANPSLGFLIQ